MLGIVGRRHQGPSGQHVGESDDVILGVAAAHAERMQFQNFAGEIFVEAPGAVDAGDRVRAHRNGLVEIEQHCRMAFGGQQQIGEPAKHGKNGGRSLHFRSHAVSYRDGQRADYPTLRDP